MSAKPEANLSLPNYPNKLPTNPEIARQGVEEFTRIAKLLSSPALIIFASSMQIRRCFVGTSPEVGSTSIQLLPNATSQSVDEIRELINSEAVNFLVVRNAEAPFGFSILNLFAARQTVANYPLVFPDALSPDLSEWLQNSQNWMERNDDESSNIRLGLLSGFPYSAMKGYIEYHQIFSQLNRRLNYFEDGFVTRYLCRTIKRDNQTKQAMIRLAERHIGRLSETEKKIIETSCRQTNQSLGAFVSFGNPADKIYVDQMDNLYRKSGIDLTAGRFLWKNPVKSLWHSLQTRVSGSFRE